jgi:hypothetical protein
MHEVLMANEQLSIAQAAGEIFQGYSEGPLSFMPTYKYDKGCDIFDTSVKQVRRAHAVASHIPIGQALGAWVNSAHANSLMRCAAFSNRMSACNQRVPAWTDRILYCSNGELEVRSGAWACCSASHGSSLNCDRQAIAIGVDQRIVPR